MTEQSELKDRLAQVLDDLESQISGGDPPPAALEDMKSNLDGVRTGVLAFISAGGDADYEKHARRYRLKRAAQVCESVLTGIDDGNITPQTRGFERLRSTAAETLEMVEKLRSR